ncbi:MAG: TPR end-of-group domain-containing protein, partial [Burkholderiales bacterium]
NMYVPFVSVLQNLGQVEAANRLREREIRVLQQQLELVPEDVRARILLAGDYACQRRHGDAIRELEKAVALRPNDPNILYNAACAYGVMNRKAEALTLLKKVKEVGFGNQDWIARDPDLACLHGDPEFQRLVEE